MRACLQRWRGQPPPGPRLVAWLAGACVALASLLALTGTAAAAANGDIFTLAGDGTAAYSGDAGPASLAELARPQAVAADAHDDTLVADTNNGRVRLIARSACASGCPFGLASLSPGQIQTIAGNGGAPCRPGSGVSATTTCVLEPDALAVDAGDDLLVADAGNAAVQLLAYADCTAGCPLGLASMVKGDIYTVAGDGTPGVAGDGGPATSATINTPTGLAVDPGGDLLISDVNGYRVRLVANSTCAGGCAFGLPAMTRGDIYTVAGTGTQAPLQAGFGNYGEGGPATSAQLNAPWGLAVDPVGDLLLADAGESRVRLVADSTCLTACPFGLPGMTRGHIYTVAGSGLTAGFNGDDQPASAATLSGPQGLAVDPAGDLLIADQSNARVRIVAAAGCQLTCPFGLASMSADNIYTVAGMQLPVGVLGGFSGDGGPATSAELYNPGGVAVAPAGNLLIADTFNNRIRSVINRGNTPDVATAYAVVASPSSAALIGSVNPEGRNSSYVFEYGSSLSFGSITPPASAGSGTDAVGESGLVTGLAPGTTYYFRIVGTNAVGTRFGAVSAFTTTTPPQPPSAVTLAAVSVDDTTAVLRGQVDPRGQATAYAFEYGTTTSFGSLTQPVALDDANGMEPVSSPATGLAADTTYYYRTVATNATGTEAGAVASFTTGPGGAPIVTTGPASGVTTTGAVLAATVDPHASPTVFVFEYGTTTTFGSLSAVDQAGGTAGPESVSLPVGGLAPGTTYVYRVVAANAAGTTYGSVGVFATAPGAPVTPDARLRCRPVWPAWPAGRRSSAGRSAC